MSLTSHNQRWQSALDNWYRRAGVAWTPGMIVGHDLRARFDTFLPWKEFSASLRGIARSFLPSPEWIPELLQENACDTLLDFWEEVGYPYLGRVAFAQEELMPFFCTCADPPRFGTRCGRYPEQLAALPRAASLLDLGCGIGLGTLETAKAVGATKAVLGITREPLEAWMAMKRRLPHDPERSREFEPFKNIKAEFRAGAAENFRSPDEKKYELILCNGLAGGRFLHNNHQLDDLLTTLECTLAHNGTAALANHFHEGNRAGVEAFMKHAQMRGWHLQGTWQNLFLGK